jgi:CheY-like chemotaxis protein
MGRQDSLPTDALSGVHVLVVDDDGDAREIFKTVLEYCGGLVTSAASAREALHVLQRFLPDVIVSDIAMPEHDGHWLIQQIRSLPSERGGTVPAVAVTAYGVHAAQQAAGTAFQAYLAKPLDPWELCRVVASLARRTTGGSDVPGGCGPHAS